MSLLNSFFWDINEIITKHYTGADRRSWPNWVGFLLFLRAASKLLALHDMQPSSPNFKCKHKNTKKNTNTIYPKPLVVHDMQPSSLNFKRKHKNAQIQYTQSFWLCMICSQVAWALSKTDASIQIQLQPERDLGQIYVCKYFDTQICN